ncbi:MAG: formate dehydrogenase accessory sulfurtransferase FdhD [Methanobrevibacter sp.]|jgi:FdhD protein/cysteine desulfurase|nr:formate dehydrogenase accessory sulfurtransferase FdhD [Methanobrevibacter sp.]
MKIREKVPAVIYKDGEYKKQDEEVVYDETSTITINNSIKRNFSTSPDSLKDFAIGYSLGEGIIRSIKDIEEIKVKNNEIKIAIPQKNPDDYNEADSIAVSDGGGGWRAKIKHVNEVESSYSLDSDVIIANMEKLREKAINWQKTGGVHVAVFVNKDNFIVKEDVSRHVAVDKVIGAAAIKGLDFSNSYIQYSGRMPADMVIKIARVGIPILVSNAAPTFSGYSVGNKANVTLVGFVRGNRFNVYTHSERINFK